MLFIHARNLTDEDFASLNNNVTPAVRRDRRPPTPDPATTPHALTRPGGNRVRPAVVKFNALGVSPAA